MADGNEQPAVDGVETETDEGSEETILTGSEQQDGDADNESNGNEGSEEENSDDNDAEGNADESGEGEGSQGYSDFNLPEGMSIDSDMLGKVTELFKADGLNQEQAQKYIDLYSNQVKELQQSNIDSFSQLMEKWQTDAKTDKDFGGDNYEENVGIAKQGLDKFGTPELKEFLETHGAGNHPEVIRLFVKLGKLTLEDTPDDGGNNGGKQNKDHATQLYGDCKLNN